MLSVSGTVSTQERSWGYFLIKYHKTLSTGVLFLYMFKLQTSYYYIALYYNAKWFTVFPVVHSQIGTKQSKKSIIFSWSLSIKEKGVIFKLVNYFAQNCSTISWEHCPHNLCWATYFFVSSPRSCRNTIKLLLQINITRWTHY